MKLPSQNTCLADSILNDEGLYPYFKDCISAIDGTHIPAFVPEDKYMPFRNFKGMVSQNVLATCSFDFKFVYILSGWQGSTLDSLVYQARLVLGRPTSKYQREGPAKKSCSEQGVP